MPGRGVLVAAISAIDIALWDLRGKLLGQPVSVLLGGRRRERVKVYATGMYFIETDDLAGKLADEAQMYAAQGFRAVKMKVGLGVETDLRHTRAVRRAIGDDVDLMVDANHGYSLNEALRLPNRSRSWTSDFSKSRSRPRTTMVIANCASGPQSPLPAANASICWKASASVEPALRRYRAAGYLRRWRTQRVQADYRIGTRLPHQHHPHSWGSGIAFAAGLHLVSTIDVLPGRLRMPEPLLEMDRSESPLREKLTPAFPVEDGRVAVPTAPGLGVDVDPDALADLRREPE